MKIRIKHIDAFTGVPHTGNPAAVVLDGKYLSEVQMGAIARELNLPGTAYVLPSVKPGADLKFRSFGPGGEIGWCSHAAIAGLHALAEEGLFGLSRKGSHLLQLDAPQGTVTADVVRGESGGVTIMVALPIPALEKATQYKPDLVRLLNINLSDFDNRASLVRDDSLFVGIRRLHTLFTMKPAMLAMANFLSTRGLRGICAYTTETVDRGSAVHSRFFAPHLGVNEDPATCETHAVLALLLHEMGMLAGAADGRCHFRGEQGDVIGRRGRIDVELLLDEQTPASVRIGGGAVTVMEGEMNLGD